MSFSIAPVRWQDAGDELSAIRRQVFIEEQAVPESLEWDGLDETAQHLLARDSTGQPIGCARLLPSGRIGRMAVLPQWRGHGVGRQMLQALLEIARSEGWREACLSAQVHAIPFYQQAGFEAYGPTYDDAGIPHRDMRLTLNP